MLYANSILYERREEQQITEDDIRFFKEFAGKDNVIDELVSQFAPNVIGHSDAKLGILRSAVNTKSDKLRINSLGNIRNRTHTLLTGDKGTAKTMLAQEAKKIVPNSRYVVVQHASVKTLHAIIDKEPDNSKMLRLGAVPMSKNAVCAIDEIGTMPYEDQQYSASVMEEGMFTIDKYGIHQEIDSPTTIIATSNPHGGHWNPSGPGIDQIPIKANILDRFDQIYAFIDFKTDEERREYVTKKMEMNLSPITYDYDFLERYIQYAASLPEPIVTAEASIMLSEFWMRITREGLGANRSLDSLVRIARGQARLHLTEEVDVKIANEVIQSVGLMCVALGQRIDTEVRDPRDLAFNLIIDYVNTLDSPIAFIEAVKYVCANCSNVVKQYIGGRFSISENKHLRAIHDIFSDGGIGAIKTGRTGLSIEVFRVSPLALVKKVNKNEDEEDSNSSIPEFDLNDLNDHPLLAEEKNPRSKEMPKNPIRT